MIRLFADEILDPTRTTRLVNNPLVQWREFALVAGDELLVDVSAYHDEFGVAWCEFLRAAPGSASVYPYKVQIPERGVGQYRADEILGWRRPVDVHHGLLELDAIRERMAAS